MLRIIESSLHVRDLRQLFLWSQGQLQALLPHQLMICMQFGTDGALERMESVHAGVPDAAVLARLCDPHTGLALRLARHGRAEHSVASFQPELSAFGYDHLLLDGSGPVAGAATAFVLFGLPAPPEPRHAYFLALLMPHLHLALLRLARQADPDGEGRAGRAGRALSAREAQIVHWLRAGKRNAEIGTILGLSALTVKNHLQRIYKLLRVRNRGEAVARCAALPLFIDQRRAVSSPDEIKF